ncbi:MAG: DUF3575 domain-containing protein, partial [Muribaculaceae bacterium]|nr:DUF3575 domain-containing protein [Muribaculaceae bacterium]
ACTSPEGASAANERLSQLRCQSISDFLIKKADIDPQMIHMIPEGVGWQELRRLVAENPDVPSREKIIDIIDNVPLWIHNSKGAVVDGRKKRLMELDRGETFRWLSENIFPELRNAVAIALYVDSKKAIRGFIPEQPLQSETSVIDEISDVSEVVELHDDTELSELSEMTEQPEQTEPSDTVPILNIDIEPKHFHMSIKTNMLYDAVLVPNLGAEFYLGKDISIYGEWMYAWWDKDRSHLYWRVYGGDLGLRWWFGKKAHAKPLTGHHLGVFGGILTFDFEIGDTGYLGGKPRGTIWDRWILNTGIEYGYSMPIGKRLNIDFSIGLGYMGGKYIKYYPFDNDYYFDKEFHMHYFGPTKAEISLVWLIGRGNANSRKGGEE